MGAFCLSASEAIWPYLISNSEDSQTESTLQRSKRAGKSELQEWGRSLLSWQSFHFWTVHVCTHTHSTEMHSSGVTGWMQIGYDSLGAMIYWVIGATHESRSVPISPCSQFPIITEPLHYVWAPQHVGLHSSFLSHLSVSFERLRREGFYLTLFWRWKPR